MWKNWNDLPEFMRVAEVLPYWEQLNQKKVQMVIKRIFDLLFAIFLLILFSIPMIIIALLIRLDSDGSTFYLQERVTTYGRRFQIHKFRTMIKNADKLGSEVTADGDKRVTRLGAKLRKYRLDEIPQLIDVIQGNMSFVGTRPEVSKYVEQYKPEYYATLLLPAGITSEASIRYLNEATLLKEAKNIDSCYLNEILPEKMKINLQSIKKFSLLEDIKTMMRTIAAVIKGRA